jgi:hypothetical protein
MRFLKRVLIGWVAVTVAALVGVFTVKKVNPAFGDQDDDWFSVVAVIGGRDFASTADRLEEGSALAVMGGVDLDLREATIGPGAKLKLTAFMGGIDVTVPSSWRVEVIATERMGEVVDMLDRSDQDEEGPLLLVYAKSTMGGISISTPREA